MTDIKKVNGDVVVTGDTVLYTVVDEFVAHYDSAALAMLAVARRFGIAVNYMDREVVESRLDRVFTDEEWVRLAPELEDYDAAIDDGMFASDTQSEFLWDAVKAAGLTIEDGE